MKFENTYKCSAQSNNSNRLQIIKKGGKKKGKVELRFDQILFKNVESKSFYWAYWTRFN
jgi:hypothetical protein